MHRRRPILGTFVVAAIAAQGCARAAMPVRTPSARIEPRSATDRMGAADALVRLGCLDCLVDAYREYEALSDRDDVGEQATEAGVRAATLAALRERELGLVESGYMAKARALAARRSVPTASLLELVDVADALPFGPSAVRAGGGSGEARALLQVSRDWLTASEAPFGLAAHNELFGYVWLALACDAVNARTIRPDEALAGIAAIGDFPLIVFKYATACDRGNTAELQRLLTQEPRFAEINYYLGLAALSGLVGPGPPGRPDLDEADAMLRAAYAWRPEWPALLVMLGNVATAAEDFGGALELYQQALALVPDQPDALLGAARSLSHLNRHADAIAVADSLIRAERHPGDARYWRAFNLVHLGRYDEAWTDIERAATLVVNADVPKLAGIVAVHRGQFDAARQKLEEAGRRRASDCEVGFYLQTTLSMQRDWALAADTARRAGACFDEDEAQLRREIDEVQASQMTDERQQRLIARRAEQISTNARMRAACWFNAAAAHFNLGEKDDARLYAQKVAGDERFGDRARDLLARLSQVP
jgi:tetratricopeptide (TPR) repeat protein